MKGKDKRFFIHTYPGADTEKIEGLLIKSNLKSDELQYLTDNIKIFDTEEEYLDNVYLDTDKLKKEISHHVSEALKGFKINQILLFFIVVIEPIYIFNLYRFLRV